MIGHLAFIGLLIRLASQNGELHEALPPLDLPEMVAVAQGEDLHIKGGGRALAALHPELRARLERVVARLRAAGDDLRILSVHRPLDRKQARRGHASWHAFGMAVDVNLPEYTSMRGALDHMGRDRARWERLGRLVEGEGMIWGGRWRVEEVFHIEWHPGMPAGLNGPHLTKLLSLAGSDGRQYPLTWPLFAGDHPAEDMVSKGRYLKKKKKPAQRPKARSTPKAKAGTRQRAPRR